MLSRRRTASILHTSRENSRCASPCSRCPRRGAAPRPALARQPRTPRTRHRQRRDLQRIHVPRHLADLRSRRMQGGLDYAHASGFYAGTWDSNVASSLRSPAASAHRDGFLRRLQEVASATSASTSARSTTSTRAIEPTSAAPATPRSTPRRSTSARAGSGSQRQVLVRAQRLLRRWTTSGTAVLTQGYRRTARRTRRLGGTWYLDLGALPVTKSSVVAHYGMLEVDKYSELDYTDWKLGVVYDFERLVLGGAYMDTDADAAGTT